MKSYLELVQETLVPPVKEYYDEHGNYRGSQVNVYPAMRLLMRTVAWLYVIKVITWPLWAPFVYWIVRYWCKKHDKEMGNAYPQEWPERKKKMLLEYKLWMYLWIGYMYYGFLTDWGQ